jgi:integral membrane sensor domain MASE1
MDEGQRGLGNHQITSAILQYGLFVLAFYFAYRYGMAFSQEAAAPFWFPDSVLLSALLWVGPRWWPLLLATTLPIRLLTAAPAATPKWFLVVAAIADCGNAVLAASLLRLILVRPFRFQTVREFGLYCLVAVILASALSATVGAAVRAALGYAYWQSWEQWFWSDALANLVITPVLFYWVLSPPEIRNLSNRRMIFSFAAGSPTAPRRGVKRLGAQVQAVAGRERAAVPSSS